MLNAKCPLLHIGIRSVNWSEKGAACKVRRKSGKQAMDRDGRYIGIADGGIPHSIRRPYVFPCPLVTGEAIPKDTVAASDCPVFVRRVCKTHAGSEVRPVRS